MSEFRIEKDSLGEVRVPAGALYAAQTQRAVENFPVGGPTFPPVFVKALGLIKGTAARVNMVMGLLDKTIGEAIVKAADEVVAGQHNDQFPVDIFQTGSGTSTNMNANEVIATRATQLLGDAGVAHPNDHVNMGQSSNDVIPTAIHVSAALAAQDTLSGLEHLRLTLIQKGAELRSIVKTGRTHLMDAMPLTLEQELGAWAFQVEQCQKRIQESLHRVCALPQGGTAVGTGINAHPEFGARFAGSLRERVGIPFRETENHFAAQASMDAATELSGQLKVAATALMKIANDLRWMNSGPIAGLGEITLTALQPGSSIMPGKINPVICESMMMICAQVMGNDLTVAIGNERGNFQLNVMLPVIGYNVLQSLQLLGNGARMLADKAVAGFGVNDERIRELIDKNPILVTALNSKIGYDLAAKVAKTAYAEGRRLKDVALDMTDLSAEDLDRILDPAQLTKGGIKE